MKVLLKQDHEGLGKQGDVAEVKKGFARNYLIPQNIALPVNKGSARVLEQERRRVQLRQSKERRQAERLKHQLEEVSLTAPLTVGEEDRVFGAVTNQTVAELLTEKGFTIDRRRILLEEPINTLGIYPIRIRLHPEVDAEVKLWVVKA